MPHPQTSSSFLRRLFVAAGWKVEDIPAGWRARRGPEGTTVLAYLDGGLPAGFQRHYPSDAQDILVLFGHAPDHRDRDRVEITGARAIDSEEVPGTVVALLHLASEPHEEEMSTTGTALASGAPAPLQPEVRAPEAVGVEEGGLPLESPSVLEPATATAQPAPPPLLEGADSRQGSSASAPPTPPAESPPPPAQKPLLLRREPPLPMLPGEPSLFPALVFESDRIVRPRLHEEDIHQMAHSRWRGGSPRLVLVPFYLFAYALPEDEESSSTPPRLVAVPTVGGAPQFWPPGEREIVSALPQPYHRMRGRIRQEDARKLALEAVRERHARSEERAEKVHGVLVIDHHRHPLEAGEVRMGAHALVWVPHWIVEAWNGREVLDAVTGLSVHLDMDPGEAGE